MILAYNHHVIKKAIIQAAENGMSFGVTTVIELEMAEIITQLIPSIGMVRMVNLGEEATIIAMMLTRSYT